MVVAGAGNDLVEAGDGNDLVFADAGIDTVFGYAGSDTIDGGDDADAIFATDRAGNDSAGNTLTGGAGNDSIYGSNFADSIQGGSENDGIIAYAGSDTARGGTGDDTIIGGADNDQLFGDAGADSILADAGNDSVEGGDGNDTIAGADGNDTLHGQNDNDLITGGNNDDLILAGAGLDTVRGNDGNDTILGQQDADSISGDNGNDSIEAGGGNDTVTGDAGDDLILAQDGDDSITGGDGRDCLRGDAGNDSISGGNDADFIRGGSGNDTLSGDAAGDVIRGEDGIDSITGGAGADRIDAGDGDDVVYGFAPTGTDDNAADTVLGGGGNDAIALGGGNDYADGGTGTDTISGNAGNDTILGGGGVGDCLIGAAGGDYIVGSDDGADSDPNFADTVYFGDIIDGGSESDTIFAGAGADMISGGGGNDSINSGAGSDCVNAGVGDDWIFAGVTATLGDSIDAGDGNDAVYGGAAADTIIGGIGDDRLFGQGGADSITGDGGDDWIDTGSGSNDYASGGDGNDEITDSGGAGNTLAGDAGDDTLRGSDDGSDSLIGGAGRDRIFGRAGNDTITGDSASDTIDGGAGDDQIAGNAGADLILGGPDHDILYGHSASGVGDDNAVDSLYGDSGNVTTVGNGRDQLFGGGGNDLLFGEGEDDFINAGGGAGNLVNYGAGEGANPADFVPPAPTPPPSILPATSESFSGATLPTGIDYRGRWAGLAGSAQAGGISSSQAGAADASVAIDASGTQYVAWSDWRNGNEEIYVARHVAGAWQALGVSAAGGGISDSATPSRRPSITIGADGQPIVAWTEFNTAGQSAIRVARFDGTNWVAIGSSLGAGGISNTGAADHATVLNTAGGTVVAWLDRSSGAAQVYARRFAGGTWQELGGAGNASGGGVSNFAGGVREFSAATDGTNVAVAWSGSAGGRFEVFLRQFNGTSWGGLGGSDSGAGLSNTAGDSRSPGVAYFGGNVVVAWQDDSSGLNDVLAARFNGSTWPAVNVSTSGGDATQPALISSPGGLYVLWRDDLSVKNAGSGVGLYAKRWNGSAFVSQVGSDTAGNGAARLSGIGGARGAVDPSGRPVVVYTDGRGGQASQVFARGNSANVASVVTTSNVQSTLDGGVFGAGDVIVVNGASPGFTVSAADSGVTIVGMPGSSVTGAVTINGGDVTLINLTGATLTISGGNASIQNSVFAGTAISGTGAQVFGSTLGATTLNASATNASIEASTIAGLTVAGATGLLLRDNTITATLAITAGSGGSIERNRINATGTGLNLSAAFAGTIQDNDITGTSVGVNYAAPAALAGNRIFGSGTGIATNQTGGSALGFVGTTAPNDIYNNATGIMLSGGAAVQNQHVFSNTTGVSGSGTVGGSALELANVIELNATGVNAAGKVNYNRIARNTVGIVASAGQLIAHNLIYRNTAVGIRARNVSDVRIVHNTIYSTSGDNVALDQNASNVQLLSNILWTEGGYDLNVDANSRGGFFADYNVYHSTGGGTLIRWLRDFNDILDWQADLGDFDAHSIGRTAINADGGDPGFANKSWDDLRPFDLSAGVKHSGIGVDAASPFIDMAINLPRTNLLANPSFEAGVAPTGWTTNATGTTATGNPAPFDGGRFFFPGTDAVGFAEQTINLQSAGFSVAQLDSADLAVSFGGRTRTVDDTAQMTLTFLDASNAVLGSPTLAQARNVNDRWELLGGHVGVPVGARSVKFRFESARTGTQNEGYFDNAFLYVISEDFAPDAGAYGNTAAENAQPVAKRVVVRSPDLYRDLLLDQQLDILWDSYGNTADSSVRIDLLQDTPDGPITLLNIAAATPDDGQFTWIPLSSGLSAGTGGLRIQVSYVSDNITLDRATESSTIPQAGTQYYIDDASNAGDEFTPAAVGSNRNTGKLASSPKPLLTTLLRVYDLNPADTVNIDTGTYQHFKSVVISGNPLLGDDEGATIQGPAGAANVARLEPLGFSTGALIELNQGDFTTIQRLTLGGGTQYGLWARNTSTNLSASRITQSGASIDGVRVDASSVPVALDQLDVSGNTNNGVFVEGAWGGLSNSRAYNNGQVGIRAANTLGAATFENNELFSNGTGISVFNNGGGTAVIGNANLALGRGNKVFNNTIYGIEASQNVAVHGNTVYGHVGANHGGIRAYSLVPVTRNVTYNNNVGVWGGTVSLNRIYGNTIGVFQNNTTDNPGALSQNIIYSNGVGYRIDLTTNAASNDGPITLNNLFYANSSNAIEINGGRNGTVYNNTIYQTGGDAVRVNVSNSTVNVRFRNNVIHVGGSGGYGLNIAAASQPGINSDFNLFYITGAAKVGFWGGAGRTSLGEWRSASGQDANSFVGDPQYVDFDGADNQLGVVGGVDFGGDDNFHENSPAGSYKGNGFAPQLGASGLPVDQPAGSFTADAGSYSIVLDRGDDAIALVNEPATNGGFTNLGAFGNTTQASKSPAQYALVLRPNGGETWVANQTFNIKWRQENIGTGSVLIELLHQTGPGSYTLETTIAASAANTGSFDWLVPAGLPNASDYVIRVTRVGAPTINDVSDATFAISPPTPIYYVNDNTNQPGDLTTAAGNDANSGLSPATPKASIQAMLDAYDFGPGDIIRVDRGTYTLTNDIVISANDAGVTIEGFVDGGTLVSTINRNDPAASRTVFDLQNADDITIRNLRLTGGYHAVRAGTGSDSDGVTLNGNEIFNSAWQAVTISAGNDAWTISANTIRNNNGTGIFINSTGTVISGNEIFGNTRGIDITGGNTVSGNIVRNQTFQSGIVGTHSNGGNPALPRLVIENNTAYGNVGSGIESYGAWVVIRNNTVYGQGASNFGIYAAAGDVLNNVAYSNGTGIGTGGSTQLVAGNRVFNNASRGISATFTTTVERNVAYSNGAHGIYVQGGLVSASRGPYVRSNISYANGSSGIYVDSGTDTEVWGNTVYQLTGDGIVLGTQSVNTSMRNNIVVVGGAGIGLNYGTAAHTNLRSDYNLVRMTGGGSFGRLGGQTHVTKADFFFATGFDQHAITASPQLVDVDGADNQLGFVGGVDYGADDDFSVGATSPAIDAGDPASHYLAEPQPNGGRVNLGFNGNTSQANVSPARSVQVLAPDGLEKLTVGTPFTVAFATAGLGLTVPVMRMNAGGKDVGRWGATANLLNVPFSYGTSSVTNTIDTSLVSNPAPQAVYQQYLAGGFGPNNPLSFAFPVPDGTYTMRLHFMEPSLTSAGVRVMDVKLNGATVTANYDPFAAAGNMRFRATALSYSGVTATGGAGITLDLNPKFSTGAIISGVEISTATAGGSASPTVNIDVSLNSGASWSSIATNAPMDSYGSGSFDWTPAAVSDEALIRAVDAASPAADASNNTFVIGPATTAFYVNDNSTAGDTFTTAVGNDANSGRTPDRPMRNLSALLAAYTFNPGDVIYVDGGNYTLGSSVRLTDNSSNVRIQGPAAGATPAVFNRNNTSDTVFWFDGADNVTLSRLSITGGQYGLYSYFNANSPTPISTGITVENCEIYGNSTYGVYFFANGSGSTIRDSVLRSQPTGNIELGSVSGFVIENNQIHSSSRGVRATSTTGLVIRGNEMFSLSFSAVEGNAGSAESAWAVIQGNTIRNNTGDGVNFLYARVSGNTVFGHTASSSTYAIRVTGEARDNVVYSNSNGIALTSGLAVGNRVYNHTGTGLLVSGGYARNNLVYSNALGIDVAGSTGLFATVDHNLVYANSQAGMRVSSFYGSQFLNNTIYQPAGDGLYVQIGAENVSYRNNIIQVAGASALRFDVEANTKVTSADYNNLFVGGGGRVARVGTRDFATLADWSPESGLDRRSVSVDPQFVDFDGPDNQLGYVGGADRGQDDDFRVTAGSATIDAGDPVDFVGGEPSPNGGRVNLGHTGGTPLATVSAAAQRAAVISPNGREKFEAGQSVPIAFAVDGFFADQTRALARFGLNSAEGAWLPGLPYVLYAPNTFYLGNVTINTSAVSNPAPIEVYRRNVYTDSGVGNALRVFVPLPDGPHTLRLHWADNLSTAGQRQFDIKFNGVTAATNVDIPALAGGSNRAYAAAYNVTAANGGVLIELLNKTFNPAFLSGLEVMSAGGAGITPTVKLEYSLNNGSTWTQIASAAAVDVLGRGTVNWTATSTLSEQALVRATVNQGTQPADTSDAAFMIVNSGTDYYVNDGTLTGDVFATAAGNNLFSGKSPDKPMASLWALLETYDLDPGDVIHVDAGTYNLIRNITILNQDAGVRIEGPQATGAAAATFNRGAQFNTRQSGFELIDADNITIDRLTIIGGVAGINTGYNSAGDSDNITISRNDVSGGGYGIVIYDSASNGAVITGNTAHDLSNTLIGTAGIYIGNSVPSATVTANTVFNSINDGIAIAAFSGAAGGLVSGNTVFGCRFGINVGGSATWTITQNTVRNNTEIGIVSDTSTGGGGNMVISRNDVLLNPTGIRAFGGLVEGNRVYANTVEGILVWSGPTVRGNQVYSNPVGVQLGRGSGVYTGLFASNLVYGNSNRGVTVGAGGGARLANNTIYSIVGDAIRVESATNTSIHNNILWVEAGSALFVQAGGTSGFVADYNLMYRGAGGGTVGSWNGVVRNTLADWQAASGGDANSISTDPKFVDIDGADNFLGYRVNPAYDGGRDDNFFLARNSPAIDRGHSWRGARVDFDGADRRDDPGTTNAGSNEYVFTGSASGFALGGTAQNWRNFNTYFNLNLPFAFPLYGTNYTSVSVGTNGLLGFGSILSGDPLFDPANDLAKLLNKPSIAAMWDNLRTTGTGDDIFIDNTVTGQTRIRYNATNFTDGSDVNFAVTLFGDGRIRFDYGPGNTNLSPTVAISSGDGQSYLTIAGDGAASLTNADTQASAFAAGIVDLGAFEFRGDSGDLNPPTITGSAPAGVHGGGAIAPTNSIALSLSEAVNRIDAVAPASYELRLAGPDQQFDTSDDVLIAVTPAYTDGATTITLTAAATLVDGKYRLTVVNNLSANNGIHDLAGNLMDGDGAGGAGGNYVRVFDVSQDTTPPTVLGSAFEFNVPQQALTIQFSENVSASLSVADLVLVNTTTGQTIPAASIALSYNAGTNTATFTFPGFANGRLPNGRYTATLLAAGVTDPAGNALPADHVRNFFFVAGDANHDGTINIGDFALMAANFNQPGTFATGDFNYDGTVNIADFAILASQFNYVLP